MWKNSRVLVTGATGLLGSHLTRLLVEKQSQVTVLIRDQVPRSIFYSKESEWRLDQRTSAVHGDLSDFKLLNRIMSEYEIDTIYHLAAQTLVGVANTDPIPTFRANIEGTWNILEAARLHNLRSPKRPIQRIIVASSDKAYGNLQGESYDEATPLQGEHPYDVSKSCADLIAQSYAKSYQLPVAITRCGNFFGPGDLNFSRIVPGTILDVLSNRAPVIRSNGQFIRDYIYIEDGAHAYLSLAEKLTPPFFGHAFNFSYGLRLKVTDVVDKILHQMNRTDLKPQVLNQASNEIPIQTLDSTKAKKLLDWKPQFGFESGLDATIQWYRKHHQEHY